MPEIWRPISDYVGLYEVSDLGNVRSLPRAGTANPNRFYGGQVLTPSAKCGYPVVTLSKNRVHRQFFVHQLVAEAFLGPRPPDQEVRHLDGDPMNRSLKNLDWGTRKQNAADRSAHGRTSRGEKSGVAKLSEQDVMRIFDMRALGVCVAAIARWFYVTPQCIWLIVKRSNWRHVSA